MAKTDDFAKAYVELRRLFRPYEGRLVIVRDLPGDVYFDTRRFGSNQKPIFFAAVRIGKRYVSFHFMPVYVDSKLLARISPELREHMQGKSCFSFRRPEPELFAQLGALLRAGWESYRKAGYL